MAMNAVIYCRISMDRTGTEHGVHRQEDDCRALAEKLGWNVTGVFVDNDVSASSGKRRPAYEDMLTHLAAGQAKAIIAWHTDRLHRRPLDLEAFIAFCEKHRIDVRTVQAGELDLSTASGRMVARMLGAAARHEIEHKSERLKRARAQKLQRGEFMGGPRSFGFEPDGVTIREAEAAIVRSAADQVVSGVALHAIVTDLNRNGVPTTDGSSKWNTVFLRRLLLKPRYAGLSSNGGEVVGRAVWPAIIPESTWRAVCTIVTDPARRTNNVGPGARWLGSGIYVCGVCGSNFMRVSKIGGRPVYRCKARVKGEERRHVGRDQRQLDEHVTKVICARLAEPDMADLFAAPQSSAVDVAALHVEADELDKRLGALAVMFAAGQINENQLQAGTAEVERQRADVLDQIAGAAMTNPLTVFAGAADAQAVRKVWDGLSLALQRTILSEEVTVRLLPTGLGRKKGGLYFDPNSVELTWKS